MVKVMALSALSNHNRLALECFFDELREVGFGVMDVNGPHRTID